MSRSISYFPAAATRNSFTRRLVPSFVACVFLVLCQMVLGADPAPEHLEFFEKQIRPIFVQHCQECHGSKKQEAGLRLDTRRGFLKGTDSGPVIVAGNVDGSRLIQVINHLPNDTQMPPKEKLPPEKIAIIRKWVEWGSPWPDDSAQAISPEESAKTHWAFQSVKRPNVPEIRAGGRTSVDAFIQAALNAKGLQLSEPADRYTLIRRMTLDLWGIPPTIEDVRDFAADSSPDAAEKLMDRLLASPLYGQRWARHWLDVARYADSKGYVFTAEPRYPYSYTYRDYVVDAFNVDKPFDEFVIDQIAADAVVESNDPRLAALGFLTVGRRYLNNNHDIIDDRIDVVSRGLLGMTVGCARCHDHKFDPIPTADYYSLYGVFASSDEPEDLPIIGSPKEAAAYAEFQKELAVREKAVADYENESLAKLGDEIRSRSGDCLLVIARDNQNWLKLPAVFSDKNEPRRPMVDRWKTYLDRTGQGDHRVFGPWNQLSKLTPEEFTARIATLVDRWKSAEGKEEASKINAMIRQSILESPPKSLPDLARQYGDTFNRVVVQWDARRKETPDAKSLPDEAAEELRLVLYGEGSPAAVTMDEARRLVGRDVRDKITALKRKVDNLKVTSPGAPPRAMVLRDGNPRNSPVLIRGNPGRPGKPVPRQFLEVVAGPERKPFTKGSGRLELAQSIVDPRNPLTGRVIANRIWQHHFGTGLVPTPSDFGTRGLPPSNPELIDWLSVRLIDGGWSLKRLHRLVLSSAVYQQSSMDNPQASRVDPENRLLWRMPRLRIDFEEMRDSILAVAGRLDLSLGGRPFDDLMNPKNSRRTIYALVNRNDLPGVFRAFDFADVDASAPERPSTTVPQQALFVMNSPFVIEQAKRIATDSQREAADGPGRLDAIYRKVFAREPTSEEREIGLRYVSEALTTPTEKQSPWDRLTQALLLTNEFWFVD